jgi:hypothetical protein
MNGPMAQIVAMTCFGNAILSGYRIDSFYPDNSTFRFCNRVKFVTFYNSPFGQWQTGEIAKSPDEWFDKLKSSSVRGIYLATIPQNKPNFPDRVSAGGIGGGKIWEMEVALPNHQSDHYRASWEPGNKDEPNKKVWNVSYGRMYTTITIKKELIDLAGINSSLTKAITEIHAFSANNFKDFTKTFADALETLNSKGMVLHGYHRDLFPSGFLSLEAVAILDACQQAWVFGGMGSWNDTSFRDKEIEIEYERVSEQLFQAINEAITAGVNSTFPKTK